jgi:hypothetical protein
MSGDRQERQGRHNRIWCSRADAPLGYLALKASERRPTFEGCDVREIMMVEACLGALSG